MLNKIRSQFTTGNSRSIKAKKNILASIGIKGIDSLIYFVLVPVTLGYLNPYEYGIWLTLSSILMWVNTFDIGLGNGLRNKLAEAMAKGDKELGRAYVSTTFFVLIAIVIGVVALVSIVNPFIDWYAILGATEEKVGNLDEVIYLAFIFFCLNFVLRFVGNVYQALQLPAVNSAMMVLGHLLSLIVIYILTLTTTGNLLLVAIVYSAAAPTVYAIAYPVTFKILYGYLAPSLRYFKRIYIKDLMSIGILFFIIQLSDIALFTLSNVVMSHELGPESVTPYNIAYRYFSIASMAMTIIIAPIWSATTDAYTIGDISWIKNAVKKIHKVLAIALVCLCVMVLGSKLFYKIWLHSDINISYMYSALMGLYVIVLMWEMTYSNILNGIGELKCRVITTVSMVVLFYPLSLALIPICSEYGILISLIFVNLIGSIVYPIVLNRILRNHKNYLK